MRTISRSQDRRRECNPPPGTAPCHAQHDRYAIRETSFLWKKKQIAIISYYDWIPVILPRLENIQWYIKDDVAIFYEPEDVEDLKRAIKKLYHTDRDILAKKAFALFDNKFDHNLYENNENIIKSIVKGSFAA